MKKAQSGFTLIELMIVVAIIGILAAIALPAYQTYTAKAKFSEVIMATSSLKTAVELCTMSNGSTAKCVAASNNDVKAALSGADNGQFVTSVAVSANGVIKATGTADVGGKSYTMTPALSKGAVKWTIAGSCGAVGYC